jgi:hypothetical protein
LPIDWGAKVGEQANKGQGPSPDPLKIAQGLKFEDFGWYDTSAEAELQMEQWIAAHPSALIGEYDREIIQAACMNVKNPDAPLVNMYLARVYYRELNQEDQAPENETQTTEATTSPPSLKDRTPVCIDCKSTQRGNRKRRLYWLLIPAAMAVIGFVIVLIWSGGRWERQFRKVKLGMSEAEVVALLGSDQMHEYPSIAAAPWPACFGKPQGNPACKVLVWHKMPRSGMVFINPENKVEYYVLSDSHGIVYENPQSP